MQGNQRQTHWSYVAGIMDADGCFMIIKHKRKTKRLQTARALKLPNSVDCWAISYRPGAKIAMVEPEAIDFIREDLGFGKAYISGARKDRPNSQRILQWYLNSRDSLIEFLENVIPYLRVKKDRALHLLSFAKHLNKHPNPGYYGVPKNELDYREDMYLKMREFNGNKVAATTEPSKLERASDSLIL